MARRPELRVPHLTDTYTARNIRTNGATVKNGHVVRVITPATPTATMANTQARPSLKRPVVESRTGDTGFSMAQRRARIVTL